MIDRAKFWSVARGIFGGPNQHQVDGTEAILDGFEHRYIDGDLRWLAYYLATAFWETNETMQPVREAYYLGEPEPAEAYRKTLRYYPYYGRGLVQLTWRDNYDKLGQMLHVDLVAHPKEALDKVISADVMFVGMERGLFGGGGMAHWFNANTDDPVGARHLVNGVDHAADIAAIHHKFLAALS